ncbi:hypothetical protein PFI31113_03640 [Pandoraea fibrosis]|uniref:Uncharacterized protein n=1 Tax=Pandoraea fibrosis TaxID=1891094 RepID=A0A5E4X5N0_9BURK|nr:hypothetical protein PFI31113_03640 [Pandoraea fibrosis]
MLISAPENIVPALPSLSRTLSERSVPALMWAFGPFINANVVIETPPLPPISPMGRLGIEVGDASRVSAFTIASAVMDRWPPCRVPLTIRPSVLSSVAARTLRSLSPPIDGSPAVSMLPRVLSSPPFVASFSALPAWTRPSMFDMSPAEVMASAPLASKRPSWLSTSAVEMSESDVPAAIRAPSMLSMPLARRLMAPLPAMLPA